MNKEMHHFDAIIIGGGIAGLWSLTVLRNKGYDAILIEKDSLGSGQTFASQGLIHGGIKYSLRGTKSRASESIADMPMRWRSCLAGTDSVNLRGVKVLSHNFYMFSDSRFSSKLTAFFGSKAIEGRVSTLTADDYPTAFESSKFNGLLYQLKDLVLDTPSLIRQLQKQFKNFIFSGDVKFVGKTNQVESVLLKSGLTLSAKTYILAAGKGNEDLISSLELKIPMQLRPLHQVVVKGEALPDLFAHAVALKTSDKPRITITTHTNVNGKSWYLGGALAESGVTRSEEEQIKFARKELNVVLPWIDYSRCEFSTFRVDRAEAGNKTRLRPDLPYVMRHGNIIVCWPTKLTLAPMMGDSVLELMPMPEAHKAGLINLPRASIGTPSWA